MKFSKLSIMTGGTLASAILSFLPLACCVFPVAFAALGLGSLAFAASLMPYRPYFIFLTFMFLGLGFYFAYRPQKETCSDGDACARPASRKASRIVLWIITILTLMLVLFPYLLRYISV